jgi:hypothetical protein
MKLRKYSSDPSIRQMMGAASDVRFTGSVVQKMNDGKTVVINVSLPDVDEPVKTTVTMIPRRFNKVSVSDVIAGTADIVRDGASGEFSVAPSLFVVRDPRGRQIA